MFPEKYDTIESELLQEFRSAHQAGDKRKMKRCASVLSNFKVHFPFGIYPRCIITDFSVYMNF